jgi:hypothetical protein
VLVMPRPEQSAEAEVDHIDSDIVCPDITNKSKV